MYKIIGGDQKEYGPVSFDQLVAWVRDNRANAQTLVQREGGPWLPMGSLPEFHPALGIAPGGDGGAAATPGIGSTSAPVPMMAQGGAGPGGGWGGGGGGGGLGYPGDAEARARAMASGPGIGLVIVGVLNALAGLLGAALPFFIQPGNLPMEGVPPEVRQIFDAIQSSQTPAMVAINVLISLAVSALIIFGGIRMRVLGSFALVVTAAIFAMLPCNCPVCCVGLPVGIWALVVLFKPEVKSAFR